MLLPHPEHQHDHFITDHVGSCVCPSGGSSVPAWHPSVQRSRGHRNHPRRAGLPALQAGREVEADVQAGQHARAMGAAGEGCESCVEWAVRWSCGRSQ
eukprot:1137807-Pelagomonas_calceolata.AAC.4